MNDVLLNTNAIINGTPVATVIGDVIQRKNTLALADASQIQNNDKFLMLRGSEVYHILGDKFLKNVITAQGDLIIGNNTPEGVRLPIGSANQVLTSNGATATWQNDKFSDKTASILYVKTIADLPTPTDTGDGNGLAYRITQQVLKFVNTGSLVLPYTIVGNNGLIVNNESRFFVTYAGAANTSMFKVPTGQGMSFAQCFFQTATSLDGIPRSFVEGGVHSSFTARSITLVDFNKPIYNITVATYCQLEGLAIRDNSIAGGPGVPIQEGILINGLSALSTKIGIRTLDMEFASSLTGADKSFLKITGATSGAGITELSCAPGNGESALYLSENLQYQGISILSCTIKPKVGTTGAPLHPNSLTEKDLGIIVSASPDGAIPNSTALNQIVINNNTATTIIATINTPTPITLANGLFYQNGGIGQRFAFQDQISTFDSATNAITVLTTNGFTHNLQLNNVIYFANNGGALPTGILPNKKYFVRDVTATTFKISATLNGPEVDFTTNGTGVSYYRHRDGNTRGWIVNIGGSTNVKIDGFISFQAVSSIDTSFSAVVMKSNINFAINELSVGSRGGQVTVDNIETTTGTSAISILTNLQTDEGILVYIVNNTNTEDVIVSNVCVNIAKV